VGETQLSRRNFEKSAGTLGAISLTFFGVGLILGALGIIIVWGYFLSLASPSSLSVSVEKVVGINIFANVFLLLGGGFVILIATRLPRGKISETAPYFAIVLSGIYLMLIGGGEVALFSVSSGSVALRNNGLLLMVSAVLLVIGTGIYLRPSIDGKITGSIMAIVSVSLVIAGSPGAEGSLAFFGLGRSVGGAVGPLDIGPLGQSGLIVAAVAALIYPFLSRSKFVSIAYIVAAVAFIIFGISYVIPTLNFLFSPIWQASSAVLEWTSIYIAANVILAVTGFLIIASGVVGIAVFSMRLASSVSFSTQGTIQPASAPIPQTAAYPTGTASTTQQAPSNQVYCWRCGAAASKPNAIYCEHCGTKLGG
jgi:hypothetical protein